MTPAELMKQSYEAEEEGVPVDWKRVATTLFQSAAAQIAALEAQIPRVGCDANVPNPPSGPDPSGNPDE